MKPKRTCSRLVEQAAAGEPFIIAKSGKPVVIVTAIEAPLRAERSRIGFLRGEIHAPDDFDEIGASRSRTDVFGQIMKLLLDTQLLLWAAAEPNGSRSKRAKRFEDIVVEPIFSSASLWEVAIKSMLGRPDFCVDARVLRQRGLLENGYDELAIAGDHAAAVRTFRPFIRTRSTACLSRKQWSKASSSSPPTPRSLNIPVRSGKCDCVGPSVRKCA